MTDKEFDFDFELDLEELALPKSYTAERREEIDEQVREAAKLCREINES